MDFVQSRISCEMLTSCFLKRIALAFLSSNIKEKGEMSQWLRVQTFLPSMVFSHYIWRYSTLSWPP